MKYYIMFWRSSIDGELIATVEGGGFIAFGQHRGRVEDVGIYEQIKEAPSNWQTSPDAFKLFSIDTDTGEWVEVLRD